MSGRILVTYATRTGSTEGIATVIMDVLRSAGMDVDLLDIRNNPDPEVYDHLIIGGPIYMGRMAEVGDFCRQHHDVISVRIRGAFAVGLMFRDDDPEKQKQGREILQNALGQIVPAHYGYFCGKADPAGFSFAQRMVLKLVKAPIGDFRDPDAIRQWAEKVAWDIQNESIPSSAQHSLSR
ncbi:MAG: hypothetical protein D5R96_00970 [Methanocalculus sp. MSAO_Arc2]|uniref:flavodoxin domain-containing protein n=1 Tax=Methanocalculus sp. MSAO_Arc2 TaxID=2293855 RepID=UPI000FF1E05D|nr:MAG: hypothetical protein D5R96_00970 [Methanocalculus sp. MSAO_Arc2]